MWHVYTSILPRTGQARPGGAHQQLEEAVRQRSQQPQPTERVRRRCLVSTLSASKVRSGWLPMCLGMCSVVRERSVLTMY